MISRSSPHAVLKSESSQKSTTRRIESTPFSGWRSPEYTKSQGRSTRRRMLRTAPSPSGRSRIPSVVKLGFVESVRSKFNLRNWFVTPASKRLRSGSTSVPTTPITIWTDSRHPPSSTLQPTTRPARTPRFGDDLGKSAAVKNPSKSTSPNALRTVILGSLGSLPTAPTVPREFTMKPTPHSSLKSFAQAYAFGPPTSGLPWRARRVL
mmetsp:Transcript_14601/g.35521  ORF Transcript_14601/g.35521 Transcript_14601/m.35521 type:complete len:208 (-) Transcript_14601:1283-1906(-)